MSFRNPSPSQPSFRYRVWCPALLAVGFLLYGSSMTIWYYGDDFNYFWEKPAEHIFRYYVEKHPGYGFFRPVNSMINALTQVAVGWSTWPIHLISILFHILLSWTIFRFMLREGFAERSAMLGSAFFLVTQAAAAAVLQVDTFSQIGGTCFGVWSLLLLYRVRRDDRLSISRYLAALAAMAISLASKETSVAYLPIAALILWTHRATPTSARVKRWLRDVAPFVALGLFYVWWRFFLGLSQPQGGGTEDAYGYSLGLNVIRNFAQILLALTTPVSTVRGFDAVTHRDPAMLAVIAIGAGLLIGATLYGLLRGRGTFPPALRVVAIMALISLLPVYPLNHVGELYVYNALPFAAVLIGAGVGEIYRRASGARWRTAGVAGVTIIYLISHIMAIWEKEAMARDNGDRAGRLLTGLAPYVRKLPPSSELVLLNPPDSVPSYSVYRMKKFDVFKYGAGAFHAVSGRNDFIVTVSDTIPPLNSRPRVTLTLVGDSIVPRNGNDSAHQ